MIFSKVACRAHFMLCGVVLLATLAAGVSSIRAEESGLVEAYFRDRAPKEKFTFRINGGVQTKEVGLHAGRISDQPFGTWGLDRVFNAHSARPLASVEAATMYRFQLRTIGSPAAYHLTDSEANRRESSIRSTYIRELFGRYYNDSFEPRDPLDLLINPDAGRAFQVALWKLTTEAKLPDPSDPGRAKLDLYDGSFRAEYPDRDKIPSFVVKAQQLLQNLSGDDSAFYSSIGKYYNLVRINGLQDVDNADLAQDFYVLQFKSDVGRSGGPSNPKLIGDARSNNSASPQAPAGNGSGSGNGNGSFSPQASIESAGGGLTGPPLKPAQAVVPPTVTAPPNPTPTPVPAPDGMISGVIAMAIILAYCLILRVRHWSRANASNLP